MSDSSDIDSAIVNVLLNDATLHSLMPDGVYFDEASPGKTRFVIVTVVESPDIPMFNRRGFEDPLYRVTAVELGSSGVNVKAAAARIDVLLEQQALTIPGYSHCMTRRENYVRATEVDDVDATIRWQHRGGEYRVVVTA